MKIILLTAMFVLLLVNIAQPFEWSKEDTIREITWQVLHVMDWGQTLDIARQPHKYQELNPVLGKHPSVGKVNTYMALSAVAHLGISLALPKEYRKWFQYVTIGMTGSLVIHNHSIGLRIKF